MNLRKKLRSRSYSRVTIILKLGISLLITGCSTGFDNFIKTQKDKLIDGEKEFRFVSYNVPNLHYNEDYLDFKETNPWRLPDEFEIRDALQSIKQTGGKVARIYTLSVRKNSESEKVIRHVLAPGKFNEEAFIAIDRVLKIANEQGIRIILPILDNWKWWGGPKEYADFRNKEKNLFWTDSLLISDFKKTVEFYVNRINTLTGIPYKEDKAILGWETGNELQCPYSWCAEIAKFIKSLDKNHLVIQNSAVRVIPKEQIEDPNIDVVSTHYYSKSDVAIKNIKECIEITKGKKPYYVGEYGFQPTKDVQAVIDTIIKNSASGIMMWSLRFRNRDGGFYYHSSDNGGTAYRWPGFESGNYFDEKNLMNLVRVKAHEINQINIPKIPIPETPSLLPITTPFKISWQGSTGASFYKIQRKNLESDWTEIADNITDAVWPYKPQYSDTTVKIGQAYSYRIKAVSESGESDWSSEVGPVLVKEKYLVDEMMDYKKIFKKDGEFEFLTMKEIVRAKEDKNRLSAKENSFIIYKIDGRMKAVGVDFFLTRDDSSIEIQISEDSENFKPVVIKKSVYIPEFNEYNFFTSATYSVDNLPDNSHFVKIIFGKGVQLAKTEITYTD